MSLFGVFFFCNFAVGIRIGRPRSTYESLGYPSENLIKPMQPKTAFINKKTENY